MGDNHDSTVGAVISERRKMTKHTSINCCDYGADFITTDPETGKVFAIQWSWEEVQAFVLKHGSDVSTTMRETLDTFMPVTPKGSVENVPGLAEELG